MTDSHGAGQDGGRAESPADRRVVLDHAVRAWAEHPRVRDTFRALFAAELLNCSVSWPRLARSFADGAGCYAGDVCVELARSPAHPDEHVVLSFTADSAARLVDASLGGRPATSMASASGQPSDAECGVLAYLAARLLASRASSAGATWLVRDVRPREQGFDWAPDGIAWPLAFYSSLGTLQTSLWLPQALISAAPRQHALSLVLAERVDIETLSQLVVGDVWLSDDSPLTLTSEGLTGPVRLAVSGCDAVLPGRLARGKVRIGPAQPADPTQRPGENVELVITTRSTNVLELARLASGHSLAVDASGRQPALLRHLGNTIATGELVSWRGAQGIRIVSR